MNRFKITIDFVKTEAFKRGILIKSKICDKAKQTINAECSVCGFMWKTNWDRIKTGCGCRRCSGYLKFDLFFVKNEAKKRKILVLSNIYKDTHSMLDLKCLVCKHLWKTSFNSIKRDHGCPKCSGKMPLNPKVVKNTLLKKKILNKIYICKKS
jgi:rubredoxin